MSLLHRFALATVILVGTAAADPAPLSSRIPSATIPPTSAPLVLTPLTLVDIPKPPVPSLRLEAARVAGELFGDNWRYPLPGPLVGFDGGAWFVGEGHYRPRSSRAGALHAGSIGATLLGEILMAADSPLAGVGALLTGATFDAAAADADRDAEARGAR